MSFTDQAAVATPNATSAPTTSRVRVVASRPGRRLANQVATIAAPSSASTYACGARPTAAWTSCPPGTWMGTRTVQNASSSAA